MKIKPDVNHRYVIRNPSKDAGDGKHRSFRIQKQMIDRSTWKPTSSGPVDDQYQHILDNINRRFQSGLMDWEEARLEVEGLRARMYRAEKSVFKPGLAGNRNLKAAERYLDAKYPPARRVKLSNFPSARYETLRAVEALGDLSILSAKQDEIQTQIDTFCQGDANRQRRIVFKLRAILEHLRPGSGIELTQDPPEQGIVRYLTKEEFPLVLKEFPDDLHRTLAEVCFYLGCRVGEACALTLADLKEARETVFIYKQVLKEDQDTGKVKAKTKNKKRREAFIFPEGISALKRWVGIKSEMDEQTRNHLARTMTKACGKVFPKDESKHLVWHDLRHCYAIRLLEMGATIKDVADMIGDSVIVAERHYTGFIVSDSRMDRIRQLAQQTS